MAQKKTLHSKNKKVLKDSTLENEEEIAELDGPKAKKSIDLESALEPAAIVEEKIDDEVLAVADDSEDSSTEELSLDDDELNPFGDKWEQ